MRKTKTDILYQIEFAQEEIGEASAETVKRLRYCFPALNEGELLAMALKHPDVMRWRRYWMRRAYALHRRMRTAKA